MFFFFRSMWGIFRHKMKKLVPEETEPHISYQCKMLKKKHMFMDQKGIPKKIIRMLIILNSNSNRKSFCCHLFSDCYNVKAIWCFKHSRFQAREIKHLKTIHASNVGENMRPYQFLNTIKIYKLDNIVSNVYIALQMCILLTLFLRTFWNAHRHKKAWMT